MAETIAVLRNGRGMDLDRYVARTFKSAQIAFAWANRQDRTYAIRVLNGKFRAGDRVPFGIKTRELQ